MECKNLKAILEELGRAAEEVEEEQVQAFADEILRAKKIFVAGAGRSGCAASAFANRLMHLGFTVYYVGEITNPPISEGDLLVIGSGSGTTAGLVAKANKAVSVGARVATVTISPENTIGQLSGAYIRIPGTTRLLQEESASPQSLQPVGSMFEQLSWLVYDSVVIALREKTGQTNDDLIKRHGNLE